MERDAHGTYTDIFDFALPALLAARDKAASTELAVTTLHMTLLAEYADSHIARKHGLATALAVQQEANSLEPFWQPAASFKSLAKLKDFDLNLKARGLNPGTTADFVVATLFTARLTKRKQP